MADDDVMKGKEPLQARWDFLRAAFAPREDPYAGADLPSARRLIPMLVLLEVLLTLAFFPMAPPDEAIGQAGWVIALALVVAKLVAVRRVARPGSESSFNELLAISYLGIACVAVLEWLAGGHSPYMMLYLLWVGAGVGVHPARRAAVLLVVVLAAGALPLAYAGATSDDAREIVATSLLWLAIGVVLMVLMTRVRAQRVELRTGERSARQEAEGAERRVRALQQVADVALAQLPLDELLQELLNRITSVLGVDAAAILLTDEKGDALVARAAVGVDSGEPGAKPAWIAVGDGCAGRVAAENRTILLEDIEDTSDLDPLFRGAAVRALLGVPLQIEGRMIGVLQVASGQARRFTSDEMRVLELAGDRIAQAIDRARLNERAHEISETLQRALLPDRLPEIPAVSLAARYIPGGPGTEVGGDWYDVVPFPDGRVVLIMGDVVGKGVAAATLMGQLRNGLRIYSLEYDSPADILDRMNILLSQLGPNQMSTAVVITFDPGSNRLCCAAAGHPPPIVLGADGEASFLESAPSVPLGILPYGHYHAFDGTLDPGATLLLYTDGLIERRDESLGAGLQQLRAAVSGASGDPEELCDRVLETLLPQGPPGDDVALLALRSAPIGGPRFHLDAKTDPDELAVIRRSLERWLDSSQVEESDAHRITLAANEACMNAIEHGYGRGLPGFEIDAVFDGASVDITVRDRGHWRVPRENGDGRGLDMMRALVDEVEVVPADDGTTVTLRRSVRVDPSL